MAVGTAQLLAAGVPRAEVDAELLIGFVVGESRGTVQAGAATGRFISDEQAARIRTLFDRRASREPLQHITGCAPFRHLELLVGPGVFVPRPETEGVTQIALDEIRDRENDREADTQMRVVDLCTGSGAIALAIAQEAPTATVWGVEKSEAAFSWADKNMSALGLDNVTLVLDDAADALPELNDTVSLVISNPPYIPRASVPRDPEVELFDPEIALYGGEDGLDVVRDVCATAARLLTAGGLVVVEHGESQAAQIQKLLDAQGFREVRSHQDFTNRDRATTARK
jgi:release factor glutamine methyltransferase